MNSSRLTFWLAIPTLMLTLFSARSSGVLLPDRKCKNLAPGCTNQGCTYMQNGACTDNIDPSAVHIVNAYKIVSYNIGSCGVEPGSSCLQELQVACSTYYYNDSAGFDANRSCGDQSVLKCIEDQEEPRQCK